MFINRRNLLQLTGGLLAVGPAWSAPALDKMVRITVATAAGSTTDAITRFIVDKIRGEVGNTIIVENKPGADGNVAARAVITGSPAEYRVLVSGSNTHAANASIYRSLPFDPDKDFEPMTTLGRGIVVFAINPKRHDFRSLQDLIAEAKKGKGLSWASASVVSRVVGERFRMLTGLDLVNVSYTSSSQAMTNLLGGDVDFFLSDVGLALPLMQDGKVRCLAISVPTRLDILPDVPTLHESGFPNFDMSSWVGAWTVAGTPPEVTARLAGLFSAAMESPAGRKFLIDRGVVPFPGSPEFLRRLQRSDTEEWGKVIRAAKMAQD